MATVTRVTGLQATVGTVYSVNANLFLLTVKKLDTVAVDLRAEDDAIDEAVEQIVKELNPLAYFITNDTSGKIHLVMDKNSNAADIQLRVRRIATSNIDGSTVGPNFIDIGGSTVVAASTFTVA
ncbi:hypothetical protein EB001_17925 [bacterium]|nr:hypothetical protein [bacterium]